MAGPMERPSIDRPSSSGRYVAMTVELAIIGAAWYFLKLDAYLVAVLVGLVIASAFVPRRYSALASGLGFLALALFVWLYAGNAVVGGVLGVFGALLVVSGAAALKRPGPYPE
ncbi:MAG: hypothetical protein AMXMBFR58_00840 [Phycisphaerae bacterium]|nr:hypothetical protein [Phycisphaerales bacterium]